MLEILKLRIELYKDGKIEELWNAVNCKLKLPTVAGWHEKHNKKNGDKSQSRSKQIREAIDSNDMRSAERIIADVPSAAPGQAQSWTS